MSEIKAENMTTGAYYVEMPTDMPWAHVAEANGALLLGLDEGNENTIQLWVTERQALAYARAILEAVARLS